MQDGDGGGNFVGRWGDDEMYIDDRYYRRVPGFVALNYQFFANIGYKEENIYGPNGEVDGIQLLPSDDHGKIVGLSSTEIAFVETIMMFKFDVQQGQARPDLETIGFLLGKTREAARKTKVQLIAKGALYLDFDSERRRPDEYFFTSIIKQCRWWHDFWLKVKPEMYKRADMLGLWNWVNSPEGQTFLWDKKFGYQEMLERNTQLFLEQRIRNISTERKSIKILFSPKGEKVISENLVIADLDLEEKTIAPSVVIPDVEVAEKTKSDEATQANVDRHNGNGKGNGNIAKPIIPSLKRLEKPKKPKVAGKTLLQQNLAEWMEGLLHCTTGKKVSLEELTHFEVFQLYPREIKVAASIRDICRTAVKPYLRADGTVDLPEGIYRKIELPKETHVELLPEVLFSGFWGANGKRTGWLFRKDGGAGLSPHLTITAETMLKYIGVYLRSDNSVLNKREKPSEQREIFVAEMSERELRDLQEIIDSLD